MTVAVVLIFATCITSGIGLTFHTGLEMRAEERFFAGWVLGIVAFTLSGIVATRLFSFGGGAVAVAAVGALAISVPGWRRGAERWNAEARDLRDRLVTPLLSGDNPALLLALLIPVWVLIARMFYFAYQPAPDGGIAVGHLASFSDWQAHLTYTASFAYADNTALNLPLATGYDIGYHAGINYFAALLIPAGASLPGALQISGAFTLMAFPAVMYSVGMRVFGRQAIALLGTVLFLFFGGWGFLDFFDDLRTFDLETLEDKWVIGDTLRDMPRTYTRQPEIVSADDRTWWNANPVVLENPIVGHFFPQRPTMIGFPIVLLVLGWLWTAWSDIEDRSRDRTRTLVFCGVLVGLTPFFNLFAFGVPLAFVGLWWVASRMRTEWLFFLMPAAVLALPVVLFLQPPQSALEYPYDWVENIRALPDAEPALLDGSCAYGFSPESLADTAPADGEAAATVCVKDDGLLTRIVSWISFWFRNLGFFLPLLIAAQTWRGVLPKRVAAGLLPVWLFFVVPNVIKPHPWNGNNTHYFIFVLLLGALPVAALLVHLLRKAPPSLVLVAPLMFTLTASGFIDAFVTNDQATSPWPLTAMDSAGVAVGEWARTTDADSVFVIELGWAPGQASPHQHPVPALSGREVVIGNDGWVFDLGITDWDTRKTHSRIILEAGDGFEELIETYDVDYLVIGPNSRTPNWDPNTAFWEEAADVVYRHAGWTVYEV